MRHQAAQVPPPMAKASKTFVEGLFAYRGALQAFFYRRQRTKSDAADLVQEVYVHMLRVSEPEAIRNPEPYLFTVAANLLKENAVADRRQAQEIAVDTAESRSKGAPAPAADTDANRQARVSKPSVLLWLIAMLSGAKY
jgi:DNA-directed RNA polymerase specialized sigma24 family protein